MVKFSFKVNDFKTYCYYTGYSLIPQVKNLPVLDNTKHKWYHVYMKSRNETPRQTFTHRRDSAPGNHETHTSAETSKKSIGRKSLIIAAILTVGGGLISYNNMLNKDAMAGPENPNGVLVESVTKIKIGSGAIVRSAPYVLDHDTGARNTLGTYDFGDAQEVTIDTPNGVYIHENVNGRWYGIHRDDLKSAPLDSDSVNHDLDKDGYEWINEQRAESIRDYSE